MVLAAAVLAITGFCVSIAASVRLRRPENALLAALGVPAGAAARQLSLEKLMLSVPSALAGLALGAGLAELLVPAITLTTAATAPIPPVLVQFGWAQTAALAVAVAVIPVLVAALAMARRPDPAAALRTAETAWGRRSGRRQHEADRRDARGLGRGGHARAGPARMRVRVRRAGRPAQIPAHADPGAAQRAGRGKGHGHGDQRDLDLGRHHEPAFR